MSPPDRARGKSRSAQREGASFGKVAWIVGAAGGLGRAVAQRLATDGARVILSGRHEDTLAAAAATLTGEHAPWVLPVDVRADADVRAAVARIRERYGRLDHLVNATTVSLFGEFLDLDDATWTAVLDTKILGYVRTARAALPLILDSGGGAIVNLSGRGGRQPNAVHLPGGASNAAVNLITKGLADRFGAEGVRVNAVAPGPIRSPRFDDLRAAGGRLDGRVVVGEPEDIADAVAFLLSDRARNINGTVLAVDGGSLATV